MNTVKWLMVNREHRTGSNVVMLNSACCRGALMRFHPTANRARAGGDHQKQNAPRERENSYLRVCATIQLLAMRSSLTSWHSRRGAVHYLTMPQIRGAFLVLEKKKIKGKKKAPRTEQGTASSNETVVQCQGTNDKKSQVPRSVSTSIKEIRSTHVYTSKCSMPF